MVISSLNLKKTSSGNHISVRQITPQGGQWYVYAWTGVRCHPTMPCQTLGGCFDYQACLKPPPPASCFDWTSHTPAELPSPATAVLPTRCWALTRGLIPWDSIAISCNLVIHPFVTEPLLVSDHLQTSKLLKFFMMKAKRQQLPFVCKGHSKVRAI